MPNDKETLTKNQRFALLRYLSGEDIDEIARDLHINKVSEIKQWLYDLDSRGRLTLERQVKLDLVCTLEKHSARLLNDLGSAENPFDTRNLTVAIGVLQDKIQKAREEIHKIEAQIITHKPVRAKSKIKVRDDYDA